MNEENPTRSPTSALWRRWAVPAGISGTVLSALAGGAWLLRASEVAVNTVALADEPKGVTVTLARGATFREERRYVGTLEPWLEAAVGPQLASGYVDTVLVRPGAIVKRGQVLATLDCRNAAASSRAIAHQARALEQRQRAAAREASRLGELLAGGYAAPNEVEQKQAQAAASEAQIQALQAQAAGKSLEVGDCVLRAPFDGEVSARLVDPGAFARPGSALVRVVDRSVVRLTADVPEVDYRVVSPKTPVRVTILATGKELTGVVARRAPAAAPSTRTVHVEIDLPNAARELPVGTTAEVHVGVGEPVAATEIPLLAAKVRGKSAAVFVVDGSVARKLDVGVLGERGGSLFLKPELPAGAQVVTQGRSLLSHDDRVMAKIEARAKGAAPPGAAN